MDGPNGARRLASRVHEVTGGNPFYAIELLKTLFAQELLRVDPVTRAWNVSAAASGGMPTPAYSPTVHDAIADRIECLPDELHAVLITIASSGRGCRPEVLHTCTGSRGCAQR